MKKLELFFSLLRIALGFLFFWPFIDKLFGLGFATVTGKAWLDGISPTAGFLEFGADSSLSFLFKDLVGFLFVDWIFMLGLLGLGLSLMLGIGMKIAGVAGPLLMILLYLAVFPSENNPVVDEHIIYLLLFLIFGTNAIGHKFSLYPWWKRTKLVKKYPILV